MERSAEVAHRGLGSRGGSRGGVATKHKHLTWALIALLAACDESGTDPDKDDASSGWDASTDGDSAANTDGGGEQVLGADQAVLPDPAWACGMASGIPALSDLTLVFEARAAVGQTHDVGLTQYGERRVRQLEEGALSGPDIVGSLRRGNLDLELVLSNGARELEEVLLIQTDDDAVLFARVCGVAPVVDGPARVVFDFEAPNGGPYAFLQEGKYIGSRELDARGDLVLRAYAVGDARVGDDPVRITKPDGVPMQSWECPDRVGTPGDVAYQSDVSLGEGTVIVGATKRGMRQAIPITGGTLSGRLEGSVLYGGADYQLVGGAAGYILDARYVLRTADDELIAVRNCGVLSSLAPTYETRASGPYAWLNEGTWSSDLPSLGVNEVHITVRETSR